MNNKFTDFTRRYRLALAFLVPFVGITMIMLCSGYTPFGKYSMLYSDMYHQYFPFFVSFRRALLSGQSLLYNWDVGMGMDYLGLYSYYLGSPLNLLSVLVPEKFLLWYFSFLVPLKLSFASLFFAIFLEKLYGRQDASVAVFGWFYGLCAWALGFQWNVMWLDTFALLPLVVLGTISLLRDKKVLLYSISLFFSVFINYYVGLFTCIFVALVFFCYEISRWRGFGRFFLDLGRIALFSLLVIACTAVLELPTLASLQQTQSSVNAFPTGFKLNIASENTWMGLLDGMRQVIGNLGGGLEPNFKEGLPNIYCGVFSLMLSLLFLGSRKVKLRDKICSVGLLLFFILSFLLRQLDYIWHGFHFPNMIPYRFSHLFSFVLLYMAYRAYLLFDTFRPTAIVASALFSLGIFACSDSRMDPAFIAFNGGFVVFYAVFLLFSTTKMPKKPEEDPEIPTDPEEFAAEMELYEQEVSDCLKGRKIGRIALCVTICAEVIANIVSFGIYFPGTYVENYPLGTTYTASMIRYMHEREERTPFFRAEVTHTQTLNDGALNNYHGITTFTSSANVKVTEFMKSLGYGAKNTYNRYAFEESSPVCNLFLGLKYMIARDGKVEENQYFDDVHAFGDVHLLQNNAYLPLGFLTESSLAELDFNHSNNNFLFQNQLFRAATGLPGSVWSVITGVDTQVEGKNCKVTFSETTGSASYSDAESDSYVSFQYTADRSGFVCLDLDFSKRNSFTLYCNGEPLYGDSYSLPQMVSACDVEIGDVVELRVTCGSNDKGTIKVHAAILNDSIFRLGYDVLNASTWEISSFRNTRIEGTVHADRDGLLYTSVPQNGGWKVYVDGELTPAELVGDVMISVPLTQGDHEVTIVYENEAFNLGLKVSAVSFVLLAGLILLYRAPKKKEPENIE